MRRSFLAVPLLAVPLLAGSLIGSAPASARSWTPATCDHPADVLDLTNWKETLPTGQSGHPDQVSQPALATFTDDPWFVVNPTCDGVRFRAAVNGTTTSGSTYPRSELREMTDSGSSNAGWSTSSGTHTMEIDEAVTHLPNDKPDVVAGQIHDASNDITVFRLEGDKLYLTNGNDSHYQLITTGYTLGTRFTAKFVAAGGKIDAYYNGTLVGTIEGDSSGDYFKAGAYTQANCDRSAPCDDTNYGEVVIYHLAVTHT